MLLRKEKSGENRPILKLETGPSDLILEILATISLLCFFGYILYQYQFLPGTIPTHFDATGTPDDYGRKDTLWVLPAVALIVYLILTFVSRIPHQFNFPFKITPANARRQYTLSIRLLRYLKLVIVLIFFHLAYATVEIARNPGKTIGLWFLPVLIIGIFIPIIIYFVLAHRNQ